VLQHVWMRWVLATASEDREILELGDFPSIPAWREIKRRISEYGCSGIITFGALQNNHQRYYPELMTGARNRGFIEEDWPPDLLKLSTTRGWLPACPPWTKPKREWNVFHDDFYAFRWNRDQDWSKRIENIFLDAEMERGAMRRRDELNRLDRSNKAAIDMLFSTRR
jgi:hypothetical protein